MTIGKLAAAAGVPAATVRYYEQRGLLGAARRTPAGYRMYDADDLHRLRFIRHAQSLGFSLDDVQELLSLRVTDPASCERVAVTAGEKLQRVRDQIRELRRMERVLAQLLCSCELRRPTDSCPVLASLADDGQSSAAADHRATRPPARLDRKTTSGSKAHA